MLESQAKAQNTHILA